MVQEESTNIRVTAQKKIWEMASAIITVNVTSLNAFGMDMTVMIPRHFLRIILINARVIIKGTGRLSKQGSMNRSV